MKKLICATAAIASHYRQEAVLMARIPRCWSISGLWKGKRNAWSTEPPTDGLIIRIYTNYAPSGDLGSLIDRYQRMRNRQIPEPFIWLVFFALSDAIYAINTGRSASDDISTDNELSAIANAGFQSLVHRDIKPQSMCSHLGAVTQESNGQCQLL